MREKEDLRKEGWSIARDLVQSGAMFGADKEDVIKEIKAEIESASGSLEDFAEVTRGAASYFTELAVELDGIADRAEQPK